MERTVSVAAFLNTPVCSCWSEPPSSDLFAALPIFGRTQSPTSMVTARHLLSKGVIEFETKA